MIDFKGFWGFGDGRTDRLMDGQTNERTDIGSCRVAFGTEIHCNTEHEVYGKRHVVSENSANIGVSLPL